MNQFGAKHHRLPFVVFDGLDGCGKDTQIELIYKSIRQGVTRFDKNSSIWITKEPTNLTKEGHYLYQQLCSSIDIDKIAASKFFIFDRLIHSKLIRDITSHSIVLSSRYYLSTLAYQSAQGMSIEELWTMHFDVNLDNKIDELLDRNLFMPDFYFFLKISPKEAIRRITQRKTNFHTFEKLEFLTRASIAFEDAIEYLKEFGIEITIIDAEQNAENVCRDIIAHIEKRWLDTQNGKTSKE